MRRAASAESPGPRVGEETTVPTAVTLVWFRRLTARALRVWLPWGGRAADRIKGQQDSDSLRKLSDATEAKKVRFVLRIFIQKYD
jgi:hypothetical protein